MTASEADWQAFRAAPVDPITHQSWRYSANLVAYHVQRSAIRGDRVLDVGCGEGGMAVAMHRAGFAVTGVDTSAPALIEAEAFTRRVGADVRFDHASAESLPFDDHTYDLVVMASVLQHVAVPYAALREARRVLKRQGRIVVSVPQTLRRASRRQHGLVATHFTLDDLVDTIDRAGFTVTTVAGSGFLKPVFARLHPVVDLGGLFGRLEWVARYVPQLASTLVVSAEARR